MEYTKPVQTVINEAIENRQFPAHVVSMAKRMVRIDQLREKHGFKQTDNSKAYRAKLASHEQKIKNKAEQNQFKKTQSRIAELGLLIRHSTDAIKEVAA